MVRVNFSNPVARTAFQSWRCQHAQRLERLAEVTVPNASGASAMKEIQGGDTRPLAAVFDIDEVLLCNIRVDPTQRGGVTVDWVESTFVALEPPAGLSADAQAFAEISTSHQRSWPPDSVWEHLTTDYTGLNPPMPGARELLIECHRQGMHIFLVTGREEYLRSDTVTNLELVGMLGPHTGLSREDLMESPSDESPEASSGTADSPLRLVMWPNGREKPDKRVEPFPTVEAYKTAARHTIARQHRIAINVGDQLSDLGEHGDEQVLVPHSFYHTR